MSGSNSSLKTNSLVLENTGLRAWDIALPLLLLGISVVLLFIAVPYGADLWWSDATRHAMDGGFIFDMRLREDRCDLSVLRAAKLLLRVKQRRDLGVEQKNVTEAETAEMLNQHGVSYVVDQPNLWMTSRICVNCSGSSTPSSSSLWTQSRGPLNAHRERIRLELPMAGLVMEGILGEKH